MVHMRLHGRHGEVEGLCDLLVPLSLRHQGQDLRLPFCQQVIRGAWVRAQRVGQSFGQLVREGTGLGRLRDEREQ